MSVWFAFALGLAGVAHAEEPASDTPASPAVEAPDDPGAEAPPAEPAGTQGPQTPVDTAGAASPAPPPLDDGGTPPTDDGWTPPTDDGWTPLPAPTGDFGSALDPLIPPGARPAAPTPSPTAGPSARPAAPLRPLTRGRVGVRPRIAGVGVVGEASGVLLGLSATQQWWRLSDRAVRPSGATRLDLGGRVGGVRGGDVRLVSVHGVWFGPIGLLGGGAARWDRLETDGGGLAAGLGLGPQVRAVARVGGVVPWAALTSSVALAGPRAEAAREGSAREDTVDFGLDLEGRLLNLRLSGAVRDTTTLRAWEAGLGLHVQL